MKEKITNPELQRQITSKFHKLSFEDVSEEEIAILDDITLRKTLYTGEETKVQLSDILLFPQIKRVLIDGYDILPEEMEMIMSQGCLEKIQFNLCRFQKVDFSQLEQLPQLIWFCYCKNLPKNYWKNGKINIDRMRVDFDQIDFSKVDDVTIKNSKIVNVHSLQEFQNLKYMILDFSELYNRRKRMVKNVKVYPTCIYSHQELNLQPTDDIDRE